MSRACPFSMSTGPNTQVSRMPSASSSSAVVALGSMIRMDPSG